MIASQVAARHVDRQKFTYTSCYCEENVYKLLEGLISGGTPADHLFAVFISNSNQSIPLWQQRASQQEDGLVVWDYHVIVIELHEQQAAVWDLDTKLSCPCSLLEYVQHAFKADQYVLAPQYSRYFRLVAAQNFLQHFASDRSHMKAADGSWLQPPPTYPCIVAPDGCTNSLEHYRDMLAGQLHLQQQQQQHAAGVLQDIRPKDGEAVTAGPVVTEDEAANNDGGNQTGHHGGNQAPAAGLDGGQAMPVAPTRQSVCCLAGRAKYGVVLSEQEFLGSLLA